MGNHFGSSRLSTIPKILSESSSPGGLQQHFHEDLRSFQRNFATNYKIVGVVAERPVRFTDALKDGASGGAGTGIDRRSGDAEDGAYYLKDKRNRMMDTSMNDMDIH